MLPLPKFVLQPVTAIVIAAVHVYLAVGHLSKLAAGQVEWTHIWKGTGALFGAYVFVALASRRAAKATTTTLVKESHGEDSDPQLLQDCR